MVNNGTSALFSAGVFFLFALYFVVIIGSLVMMIVAVVDIVKRPDWQWRLAGQEKVLWLLLVILVNILAVPALIYWFVIRKKLIAVEQAGAAGHLGPGHMTYTGWEPSPPAPYLRPWSPPAGWHVDPSGQHQLRWWDGVRWSGHTHDDVSPAP